MVGEKKKVFLLWYWIVATATPGITPANSLQGKPAALERTVFSNSLQTVIGASRRKAAGFANQRRECPLVQSYHTEHYGG